MSDSTVYEGSVIWFNKVGIGFISWTKNGVQQKDMFVHYSDIDMDGFKMLKKGQSVTFKIGENHSGQPKAIEVKVKA